MYRTPQRPHKHGVFACTMQDGTGAQNVYFANSCGNARRGATFCKIPRTGAGRRGGVGAWGSAGRSRDRGSDPLHHPRAKKPPVVDI